MPNCVLSVGIIKSYSVYNFMIKKKNLKENFNILLTE